MNSTFIFGLSAAVIQYLNPLTGPVDELAASKLISSLTLQYRASIISPTNSNRTTQAILP